jgi:hypothetical protein
LFKIDKKLKKTRGFKVPKLAVKIKPKDLEQDVFLKRSYDGYMQYGHLELIDKRQNHTNVIGIIRDNKLQEDIVIDYTDDFEKFKILEAMPRGFYYRVNMDQQRIFINFDRTLIKAHLFTNREYVSGIYKFLTCFDEEQDVQLNVSLKSPELTEKILAFRKKVVEIKKGFFPSHFMTLEQAKKDVKSYLIYLMENYEVEVVEDELNEYLANLRRYYNNCDVDLFKGLLKEGQDGFSFQFIYKGETYKVTVGSIKTEHYFEDFDGFNEVYERECKES